VSEGMKQKSDGDVKILKMRKARLSPWSRCLHVHDRGPELATQGPEQKCKHVLSKPQCIPPMMIRCRSASFQLG